MYCYIVHARWNLYQLFRYGPMSNYRYFFVFWLYVSIIFSTYMRINNYWIGNTFGRYLESMELVEIHGFSELERSKYARCDYFGVFCLTVIIQTPRVLLLFYNMVMK